MISNVPDDCSAVFGCPSRAALQKAHSGVTTAAGETLRGIFASVRCIVSLGGCVRL